MTPDFTPDPGYHPGEYINEHPRDAAWYALTGSQRRLVKAFMGDLERGVDLMDRLDTAPVYKPDAAYLVATYRATPKDAASVAAWFADCRREDSMEDRVRGILDGWKEGQ